MTKTHSCCSQESAANQEEGKPAGSSRKSYVPSFDVWKGENGWTLKGDVPGVRPEDLDIRFEQGTLYLEGTVACHERAAKVIRREYGVGGFKRQFALGDGIDGDAVSANLQDGVVTIELPFAAKSGPKRVEIKTA